MVRRAEEVMAVSDKGEKGGSNWEMESGSTH